MQPLRKRIVYSTRLIGSCTSGDTLRLCLVHGRTHFAKTSSDGCKVENFSLLLALGSARKVNLEVSRA